MTVKVRRLLTSRQLNNEREMINGYSVRKSYLPNITDSVSDTKESFKQLFEHYQDTETSLIWKRMRISLKVPTRE